MQTEVIYEDNSRVDLLTRAELEHCHGFNLLGYGLFSRVYGSNDTPYVVKVMRGDDRGYLGYVQLIDELGKDLVNVPRIYRMVHYRFQSRDAYWPGEIPGRSERDICILH